MEQTREQLMNRFKEFYFVPGHGPKAEEMTDAELEKWVNGMESMFEDAFGEEEKP